MSFRGGENSTGTTGNFQSDIIANGESLKLRRVATSVSFLKRP